MPRRSVAEVTTILWRDIPAQVTGRANGLKVAVELAPRFQVAIDRAAAVADKVTYDQYIGEWRRRAVPLEGDLDAEVRSEVSRLEATHPPERLAELVDNGGFEPEAGSGS